LYDGGGAEALADEAMAVGQSGQTDRARWPAWIGAGQP